jgi:gas vesicle protein
MSSGKVVLGLLAGLAAGAVLGILLAPDKGLDTRKKISKRGKGFTDALNDKFNEFKDSVAEKFEKGKADASDGVGQV